MKLDDIIREGVLAADVEIALKTMDWNYDIDATDEVRLEKGARLLRELETMVSGLHTSKPELARALWETYCPYAQPGSLPASLRK